MTFGIFVALYGIVLLGALFLAIQWLKAKRRPKLPFKPERDKLMRGPGESLKQRIELIKAEHFGAAASKVISRSRAHRAKSQDSRIVKHTGCLRKDRCDDQIRAAISKLFVMGNTLSGCLRVFGRETSRVSV